VFGEWNETSVTHFLKQLSVKFLQEE